MTTTVCRMIKGKNTPWHWVKPVLLAGLFCGYSIFACAQPTGVYAPLLSTVYLPVGSSVGVWGDTTRLNGTLFTGDSSSTIFFKGKTWKIDPAAMISGGGKLVMNGTSVQSISGGAKYEPSDPSFARLVIDNVAGINLVGSHIKIDSQVVFSKGILYAGQNDILLGPVATVIQNDSNSFASVEKGGAISKYTGSNMNFTFPIGINDNMPLYSPMELDMAGSGYNAQSFVRVSMQDSIHAKKSPKHTSYAKKSWTIKFNNLALDSAIYQVRYNAMDNFAGDTSRLRGSAWQNSQWNYSTMGTLPGSGIGLVGKITGDADVYGQDQLMQANVKAILQGPWNGVAMNTGLRTKNLLPAAQPYGTGVYSSSAQFNYKGTESRAFLPANAVDWVLLELRRNGTDTAVDKSAGIMLSDGRIVDPYTDGPVEFSHAQSGSYYIVVKHRNHVGVMSAAPVQLPNAAAYDFTASVNTAYGNTGTQMAVLSNGKFGLRGGNVLPDNMLRASGLPAVNDYTGLVNILNGKENILLNVYSAADVNLDGSVRAAGLPAINDLTMQVLFLGTKETVIFQSF